MGVDVAPVRGGLFELAAELVHEDIHGTVVAEHRPVPQRLVDELAVEDLVVRARKQLDQFVLASRQVKALVVDEYLVLVWADLDVADPDAPGVTWLRASPAADRRFDPAAPTTMASGVSPCSTSEGCSSA